MIPPLPRVGVLGVVASTVVAVVVGLVAVAVTRDGNGQRATVVRVVDGDTLAVDYDDVQHRVRLLNVDTPETVDPDQPVQCLGPEATAFLQQRLPVGAEVVLKFDEERVDRYGRELAGVFDADDVLVNAEIARAGLGVAVIVEPNRRFYRQVQDAQAEAVQREVGLYSSSPACTLPARVADLEGQAAALVLADNADLDALDQHASALARSATAAGKVGSLVRRPPATFISGSYPNWVRDDLSARVGAVASQLARERTVTALAHAAEKRRIAAAAKAAREKAERIAREKAQRIARQKATKAREAAARAAAEAREEVRAAAARAAAEAREKAQKAAQERAEQQAEAQRQSQQAQGDHTSIQRGSPSAGGGGADTYTGCRAYGAGGTSVDNQGRRYNKIHC